MLVNCMSIEHKAGSKQLRGRDAFITCSIIKTPVGLKITKAGKKIFIYNSCNVNYLCMAFYLKRLHYSVNQN